eukprot:6079574-Pleurochrysis_carterae.AAC.2
MQASGRKRWVDAQYLAFLVLSSLALREPRVIRCREPRFALVSMLNAQGDAVAALPALGPARDLGRERRTTREAAQARGARL